MLPGVMVVVTALLWLGSGVCWWLIYVGKLRRCFRWDDGPRWPVGLIDLATLLLAVVLADGLAVQGMAWLGVRWKLDGGMLTPNAQLLLSLSRLVAATLWLTALGLSRGDSITVWLDRHRRQFLPDCARGFIAFVLFVPPILALQAVLVELIPYRHPALLQLQDADSWQEILPIVFASVVAAPLLEELMFRGILFGWIDRLLVVRPGMGALLLGVPAEQDLTAARGTTIVQSWGAIVVSSLLFALMHVGNGPNHALWGPDLVPLFFFACALAWLTRQTGRLTPAIVTHVLLNGFSVAALLGGGTPT